MPKVSEIMKKSVVTVGPGMTIADVAKIMTNNRIGSVIVTDGRSLPVGIVTDDDIVGVVASGKNTARAKVSDLKKKKLISVGPDEDILKVAKIMVKSGYKRMPVIKDGKLQGIVSDKEMLLVSPQMIEVLSEKLRARVERVAQPDERISGLCEECDQYSDDLRNANGRWVCRECRQS
jgi:CBS domain-containing protein